MENNIFISVVGFKHYYGNSVFKEGDKVTLRKEPANTYDKEAIAVEVSDYGICGYISNSPSTTLRGTKRASRIYDTFDSICEAEVVYSSFDNVICVINRMEDETEKTHIKGDNNSVYLENIEGERFSFSILYNDGSETKVQIKITSEQKKMLIYNIMFKKDFEMIFSDKLKISCYFEEYIKLKFTLMGNINAFAEAFCVDTEEFEKFFNLK